MANTVIENFQSISVTLDSISFPIQLSINTVAITGGHHVYDEVTLSTGDTSLSKGNIGTIGRFYARNLDATNTIQLGADGTNYPLSLKPGEQMCGRWNAAAFHAKGSAGSPKILYLLVED